MDIIFRQNMTNSAISQYDNISLNRGMVNVGGKLVALTCDGLHVMTGSSDNGENINARFSMGSPAYGAGEKRVRTVHVKGEFDDINSIVLKYSMDDMEIGQNGDRAINSRLGTNGSGNIKFNGVREVQGEHLCIQIENNDGAFFDIKSISSFLIMGSRR